MEEEVPFPKALTKSDFAFRFFTPTTDAAADMYNDDKEKMKVCHYPSACDCCNQVNCRKIYDNLDCFGGSGGPIHNSQTRHRLF